MNDTECDESFPEWLQYVTIANYVKTPLLGRGQGTCHTFQSCSLCYSEVTSCEVTLCVMPFVICDSSENGRFQRNVLRETHLSTSCNVKVNDKINKSINT